MGLNPSTFSYKELLSNKATIMMMMLIMMVTMMMMIVMVVVMMVMMMRDSSRQTRNARTATVAAYPQDFQA